MPTVARLPRVPTVSFAPRGPNDSDPADLLRFRVTPGAILIRLQKRKLTAGPRPSVYFRSLPWRARTAPPDLILPAHRQDVPGRPSPAAEPTRDRDDPEYPDAALS